MLLQRLVIFSALGYFVDVLDLFLFSVLRVPSLQSLGLDSAGVLRYGVIVLNCQMAGLLLGGIFWGIYGDKKGRLKILYGSILLYSLATLANAWVTSVEMYAVLRFLAGVGLAGEVGAAITLVTEQLSPTLRGYGTMIVAGVGLCGGIVSAFLAQMFDWRTCYMIGGIAGLILWFVRIRLEEPALYKKLDAKIPRGSLTLLLNPPSKAFRFLGFWMMGIPIWFVSGIMMVFSPELGKALGVEGTIIAAKSVLYSYFGVVLGDFFFGWLSQKLQNRKKTVTISLVCLLLGICTYLMQSNVTPTAFYIICFLVGITTGYWIVLITWAAESYGTNIRATITTSLPNLIRGAAILLTSAFQYLNPRVGLLQSAWIVGIVSVVISLIPLFFIRDTYGKNCDFLE